MNTFRDHFSKHSQSYAQFRPSYPTCLFEWLASVSPAKEFAWDCATGSGQAAILLADQFERVHATDASANQIAQAQPKNGVQYVVANASASGLPAESVDLVTVAQALHWFDVEVFYREVKRVLKRHGVLAVWSYGLATCGIEAIDRLVYRFYQEEVGAYWPPERYHVETNYSQLPFPFKHLDVPAFEMEAPRNATQLAGYLRTWSATKRFESERGFNPVDMIVPELENAWPKEALSLVFKTRLNIQAGFVG